MLCGHSPSFLFITADCEYTRNRNIITGFTFIFVMQIKYIYITEPEGPRHGNVFIGKCLSSGITTDILFKETKVLHLNMLCGNQINK